MQTLIITSINKKDKIINYFIQKKVRFIYSEQYTFLREFNINNNDNNFSTLNSDVVYMFQWVDKKIKKENLMNL